MQLGYGLRQELTTKLIMTPQLRQAISILQLPLLELAGMVEEQLLENPVLEVEEKQAESEAPAETPAETPSGETATDYFDWAEYFNDGTDTGFAREQREEKPSFEAFAASGTTLQDHLEFQLHLAVFDSQAQKIGVYLIGCIDHHGYLKGTVSEAAEALGVPAEAVAQVLEIIQTFDPPGVGARDLRECLRIQIRQQGIHNQLVNAIIEDHLEAVANNRYKQIAECLASTPGEVQQAVDIIRTLNPRPGQTFYGSSDTQYIVPDITVELVNGNYVILINDTDVPRLMINPYYRQVMKDDNSSARKYVEERMNAAVWLIKSIEQRRRTLYNVMETLIELQRDFFERGPKYFRPLTMRQVAERLQIHESTVSRATANKYVTTPQGLFSLRAFFSSGVHSAGGDDLSATRIKKEIGEMVAKENPKEPLSDQAMTDILNKQGVGISRRTVAKYREELGIAASSKRKRY